MKKKTKHYALTTKCNKINIGSEALKEEKLFFRDKENDTANYLPFL